MSPSPSDATPQMTRALAGALQAVHSVMTRLDRKTSLMLWNAGPANQDKMLDCILKAAETFSKTIDECAGRRPDGGYGDQGPRPVGPKCQPNWHEEYDVCVPDN